MGSGDARGRSAPSAAAVLEMADGLRGHDPHLAAALVDHAVRLNAADPSVRYAADLTSARALAERDAPAELATRYAAELAAAREDGREADEVAWRVVLAGAALDLNDASTARNLLAGVADEAVAAWCRPELAVARARERAVAGDVESCDAVTRSAGADAGRGAVLDLVRARAAARASSGDLAGAIELLTAAAGPPPATPDTDGGRRAAALAADHVALLLDRGDVRGALDRAAPFLEVAPGPATAVALGRLAGDVARRVHLPAGDADRAMALTARAESDLATRGQRAGAARAGLVLAEAAEAAGDLPRALTALRRAHAHELDAREAEHAATVALASAAGPGPDAPADRSRAAPSGGSTRRGAGPAAGVGTGPSEAASGSRSDVDRRSGDAVGTTQGDAEERRRVRGEGGRRRGKPVEPDAVGGAGDGEVATRGVAASTGGRRRRRDETENAEASRAERPAGGRHGRPDDASSTPGEVGGPTPAASRSTPRASSPTRSPGQHGAPGPGAPGRSEAPPAVGASSGARPVGTVRADGEDLPAVRDTGVPDDALAPTAGARRPEVPTASPTSWWAEVSTDLESARGTDDVGTRPPAEGEMSALDTLHRNALRLEVLLGRAGVGPADEGDAATSGASSSPRGATSGAPTDPDGRAGQAWRPEPEHHDAGPDAGPDSGRRSRVGPTSDHDSDHDPDDDSDPDGELPLTLVDLLAEYDLPDLRPAAARASNGSGREPRASLAPSSRDRPDATVPPVDRESVGPADGWASARVGTPGSPDPFLEDRLVPATRDADGGGPDGTRRSAPRPPVSDGHSSGRSAGDRASTGRGGPDDGPEADPGARLADLLAEAMDAFRRTEPRAGQPPSMSTGPAEGRSPR